MRKTHRPEQIIDILRQVERETNEGKTAAEACRALSISEWSFHLWRRKYGGMEKSDAKQLKELEKENARLKKLLAEKNSTTTSSKRSSVHVINHVLPKRAAL